VPYHQSDMGGPGPGAAAAASFGQPAFGGTSGAHSANGRGGTGHAHDFSERNVTPDGLAHGGPPLAPAADQLVAGLAPAPGSAGLGAHAFPGMGPGSQPSGVPGNGVPASGGHSNGVPSAEQAAPVIQPGVISQGGYVGGQLGTGTGGPQHQLPGQPVPPAAPGQAGQHLTGQPLPGQPLAGQQRQALLQPQHATPALPQSASSLPQPAPHAPGAGQHSARALGGQQNGLAPFDAQRPPLPQRQLPAGNGVPYGDERGAGYPGQLPYASGPYAAPPSAPPPQLPVGEAAQSAHAEGFGFGEAVARDAPALWLEAVLARKPRMPSDLEARLLQGSALPIDALLHDEVRHALRRGFWDALERSRH
jgi:hypothetical protein